MLIMQPVPAWLGSFGATRLRRGAAPRCAARDKLWELGGVSGRSLIYTPTSFVPCLPRFVPLSYIGVIDETDRKEAFAAGEFAAQSAFTGSGSVVLHDAGDRIEPCIVALDQVAGRTRHMPDSFFDGTNAVSEDGRRYFRRLLPRRPDVFLPFV